MRDVILSSIKRPATLALFAAVSCVAIVVAWVRFPDLVPLPIVILFGATTAIATIVAEVFALLRLVETAEHHRQSFAETNLFRLRAVFAFLLWLALANVVLLSLRTVSFFATLIANCMFIIFYLTVWSIAHTIRKKGK